MKHFAPVGNRLAGPGGRRSYPPGTGSWLRRRRLVDAQDPGPGRGERDPAEGPHQPAEVLARTAAAHPLEPVEAHQSDLEAERRAGRMVLVGFAIVGPQPRGPWPSGRASAAAACPPTARPRRTGRYSLTGRLAPS